MNPYANSKKAYQKAAVTTKDQGSLILMLYEGSLKFMKMAIMKIDKDDHEGAHDALTKAKTIISELMGSLNVEAGGEVGQNLYNLYSYMYNRLIDANIKKETSSIEEVIGLMDELRAGWEHIAQKKKQPQMNTGIRTMDIHS